MNDLVQSELEAYMEAEELPEPKRHLLRQQAMHSASCYGLNGEHLKNALDHENLLEILMGMDRYMPDSNSLGSIFQAQRRQNRNRAFIIGQTVSDEAENLEALLFGRKVDISGNNLFEFGFVDRKESGNLDCHIRINRLDRQYRITFDQRALREESRQRSKRTDLAFIERERKRSLNVQLLKERILEILALPGINALPPVQFTERKKSQLIEIIRLKAQSCFNDYLMGAAVAEFCYAALLLEPDVVGDKTRKEFSEPSRRNVFGDIRLLQNALWLKSRLISNDRAVKRMIDYIGVPEMTVVGEV